MVMVMMTMMLSIKRMINAADTMMMKMMALSISIVIATIMLMPSLAHLLLPRPRGSQLLLKPGALLDSLGNHVTFRLVPLLTDGTVSLRYVSVLVTNVRVMTAGSTAVPLPSSSV